MPTLVADAVDAFVVRRVNARLQFLMLQRRADASFGGSWQILHTRVEAHETALTAADRTLAAGTGLSPLATFSADYVNQVFDHGRDAIVFIPVLVFEAAPHAQISLGADFVEFAWCDRDEAAARLLWSGQRWAVRHIDDVLGPGGPAAEFYRIR